MGGNDEPGFGGALRRTYTNNGNRKSSCNFSLMFNYSFTIDLNGNSGLDSSNNELDRTSLLKKKIIEESKNSRISRHTESINNEDLGHSG